MYGLGWFPIHHLLHFARIYGDTIFRNSVPQKFSITKLRFAVWTAAMIVLNVA
jgi:hypothetical protein